MNFISILLTGILVLTIFALAKLMLTNEYPRISKVILSCNIFIFFLVTLYVNFGAIIIDYFNLNPNLVIDILSNICLVTISPLVYVYARLFYMSIVYDISYNQLNFEKTLIIGKKRLKFVYKYFGNDYLTATVIFSLANIYRDLGKTQEAEKLIDNAIEIYDKIRKSLSKDKQYIFLQSSLIASRFYLEKLNLDKSEYYAQIIINHVNEKSFSYKVFISHASLVIANIRGCIPLRHK